MRNAAPIAILLAGLATACAKPAPPAGQGGVSDAWIRLAAVPGRPAAGYFTIRAGPAADKLLTVTSPEVTSVELHETGVSGGIMVMHKLAAVDLPAGGTVVFKPGAAHAMLFGVDPAVKPGHRIALHFALASGRTLDASAKVIGAGDDAPPPM